MFQQQARDRKFKGDVLKSIGIILVQLLVTIGGIWYVFHDPQKRAQIAHALGRADKNWLILGWFFYGAVEGLATLRWQRLLRIQRITIGWVPVFAIVLTGLFFNLFLPGLIGGDAIRLYFVFGYAPDKKTRATLSVVMDRLFGLLSILLLASASVALRFKWFSRSDTTLHIVYLALGLLALGFAFAVLLFLAVGFGLLKRIPKRMPFRRAIVQSGHALNLYGSHYWSMMIVFILTVGAHLAYYLTYYCAARSLHRSAAHVPSLWDMLSIMPLVNTITSVPISLGGSGLRETLFQELLGKLAQVPPALAAFAASLGFAIQATWGFLGAAAYLASRRKHRPAGNMFAA